MASIFEDAKKWPELQDEPQGIYRPLHYVIEALEGAFKDQLRVGCGTGSNNRVVETKAISHNNTGNDLELIAFELSKMLGMQIVLYRDLADYNIVMGSRCSLCNVYHVVIRTEQELIRYGGYTSPREWVNFIFAMAKELADSTCKDLF